MNHKGTITLQTDRLILRQFITDEYEKIFNNYCCDSRITKYMTWEPHKNSLQTKELVSNWVASYNDLEFYQWQIVLKENKEPVGSISVVNIDKELKQMELGYCIAYNEWNKGFVTEAVLAVIKYLFEEINVSSIVAKHDSRNIASGKVMQKCNMIYYGRESANNKGEDIILEVYIISKEEYNSN